MAEAAQAASPADAWEDFLRHGLLGPQPLIANADVGISSVACGGRATPLVSNRRGAGGTSWVASLRNSYGPYARAETDIVRMSRWLQPLYVAASHAAEQILAAGGLSGGNFLGNWLLATNLHPADFNAAAITAATDRLVRADPRLPVVVRSLTPPLHAPLLAELVGAGFLLLPTRQVWIVADPRSGAWRRHRDPRRDLELARATAERWRWVPAADFSPDDFARASALFQRLYRERYPRHNPDYTPHFFAAAHATRFLEITGLRAARGGPLAGMVGLAHRDRVSCTPVLGYDLDAPLGDGLYRLLMLRAFETTEARGTTFHCSAGAGAFKFNRGAVAHVEFAAVWANHLPLYRRAALRALAAATARWVLPYLAEHRL